MIIEIIKWAIVLFLWVILAVLLAGILGLDQDIKIPDDIPGSEEEGPIE